MNKKNNNKKIGLFKYLKISLLNTKKNIRSNLLNLFHKNTINKNFYEKLEEHLLICDVGWKTTQNMLNFLKKNISLTKDTTSIEINNILKNKMLKILKKVEIPLKIDKNLFIILVIGVNGVGKTTVISKIANIYYKRNKSIILAAGDTFRAGAILQLQLWAKKNNIPVIAKNNTLDASSVIFESIKVAQEQKKDILIIDTAGRLQNKFHLMEELKKIIKTIKKFDNTAPHEIMLVLDANTGQNAVQQTEVFHEIAKITGITITKLDGTAKAGVIFQIADNFQIPIRYVSLGKNMNEIQIFNAKNFINAIF